jgi:hypothetical protein
MILSAGLEMRCRFSPFDSQRLAIAVYTVDPVAAQLTLMLIMLSRPKRRRIHTQG